jgi:hypothetical protein
MADTIYLVRGGSLVPMRETPYAAELDLQNLLARYWDLLPGEQINRSSPRRWLLVRKEMGVADAEGGAARWSLDHLFLDQEGIPTLVETKRSSDTRTRREVIAQMLEYAANAVIYWPVEQVKAEFAHTCAVNKQDSLEVLAQFLSVTEGDDLVAASERFWDSVRVNLSDERIRLILVADRIQPETQRILEFLNGQMSRAEIFAIELTQYLGPEETILVPRVLGQTAKAARQKSSIVTEVSQWSETTIISEIGEKDETAGVAARKVIEWARTNGLHLGAEPGRLGKLAVRRSPEVGPLIAIFTSRKLRFYPEAFVTGTWPVVRRELVAIPGLQLNEDAAAPSTDLHPLAVAENFEIFARAMSKGIAQRI